VSSPIKDIGNIFHHDSDGLEDFDEVQVRYIEMCSGVVPKGFWVPLYFAKFGPPDASKGWTGRAAH